MVENDDEKMMSQKMMTKMMTLLIDDFLNG